MLKWNNSISAWNKLISISGGIDVSTGRIRPLVLRSDIVLLDPDMQSNILLFCLKKNKNSIYFKKI